jgi:hypothetical protein
MLFDPFKINAALLLLFAEFFYNGYWVISKLVLTPEFSVHFVQQTQTLKPTLKLFPLWCCSDFTHHYVQCSVPAGGPDHHSVKKATTRPKKVLILTMKLWKIKKKY